MSNALFRGLATLTLFCVLTSTARAQSSDEIARLESQLAETQRVLEQLTEKVRELEAQISAGHAAPAPGPGAAPAGEPSEQPVSIGRDVAGMSPSGAAHQDSPGLPLHGFADVSVGTNNPINPDLEHVAVGNVDLYLTPELGARTSSLFEINFKVGASGEPTFDIERAQFGYQFADAATLWLGRFHTPYGYYNTAFHHGAQMTSSLRRPLAVQFEKTGGVLPAHTVGLWLQGDDRLGAGRLSYDVYAGNAPRIVDGTIDVRDGGNETGDLIVGGNVGYLAEDLLGGLRFGLSAFRADIGDDVVPSNLTRVENYGLYVVHETERWENILELYTFDNEDLSGGTGTHSSDMGFLQIAYRAGIWTPYLRYERSDFDQTDNYFAALQYGDSYRREALGARLDLDLSSALKFELAQTRLLDRALREYDEALVQYAIRF